MIKPYYQDDWATIYHGDCRVVLPQLETFGLLCTDPPYGIGADRNLRANTQHGKAAAPSRDYGSGSWDSSTPEPWLLQMAMSKSVQQIVWGGNYFGLPAARGWLVWDKENGGNGYADCELAWTNIDMAVRKIRYRWCGMLQENMANKEARFHPTQKPVPVMTWAIRFAPCLSIVDPFMGSGSTLRAAKDLCIKATGIEIEERYCEIAANRLRQEVLSFA